MSGLAKDEVKNITAEDMRDYMYGHIQTMIEGSNKPSNVAFHYYMPPIPFGPELASFMDIGSQAKAWRDEGFTINDMMRSAVNFSTIVDYVPVIGNDPSVAEVVDLNALISSGSKVSGIYEAVLKNCRFFNNERPPEDKEKLQKLRNLLYIDSKDLSEIDEEEPLSDHGDLSDEDLIDPVEIDGEDLLTSVLSDGGVSTDDFVTDPGSLSSPTKLMQLYEALQSFYDQTELSALDQLKKVDRNDPNAGRRIQILQRKIRAAKRRWETQGHKRRVEAIISRIEQLSQGGMAEYLSDLRNRFEGNKILAAVFADADFGLSLLTESAYFTALRPNGILSAPSLMNFTLSSSNSSTWSKFKQSSSSASFKAPVIGIFGGAGGSVKKFDQNQQDKFFKEDFEISFEIVQGIVDRPWFAKEFIECRAYSTVDPRTGQPVGISNQIINLSDGKTPPSGSLAALPTTVYFVRNLKVKSKALANLSASDIDKIQGGGGVSIFGFGAKAAHTSETVETSYSSAANSGEITATGTYLIGMSSVFLKKSPDPDFDAFPKDKWI